MANCDVAGIDSDMPYIFGIHSERYIFSNGIHSDILRYIFKYIFRNMYIRIYIISEDTHKIFPPHKMRSGNVDTGYYRYTGYGSSIFTISCGLYPYGLSDVIKIFLETGKWDNLSLID